MRLAIAAAALVLLPACRGAEAGRELARVRTDTLSGGVVRRISEGPTAWPLETPAALVEESRFQGEDGTPSELGEPRSLAVDELDRVYVVDGKPASIKLFDRSGKYLRTIGREGAGPGEFRVAFIAVKGGYLVVQDPMVARLSVFDTAGNFVRSWQSSCCYWTDIQVDDAGRVYVPSMSGRRQPGEPRGNPYVRWSLEGRLLDTVWVPFRAAEKTWTLTSQAGGQNRMSLSTGVPFLPGLMSALDPRGGLVYGWNGEYELVRSPGGTDTALVFGRDWIPDPVTGERRSAELEAKIKSLGQGFREADVRSAFRLEDIPGTLPAFEAIRVDLGGRVWARRYAVTVSDTARTRYDLFDSTGVYLGPVEAPIAIGPWSPQAWTRTEVVAVIEDSEGRPTVIRLSLPPGNSRR